MKNLLLLFASIVLLSVVSCGSENVEPSPQPQGKTIITVGSIPDSVKVETTTEIKFTVSQKEHPEKFSIEIDTINSYYYTYYGYDNEGNKIYWDDNRVYGSATITLNGKSLNEIVSLIPDRENTISFTNPTAVGEYVIVLSITDKFNRVEKKEIKVKVFSPEIVIKFYDLFPGYDEKNYFTTLNKKYSYNPLSKELKGRRVDTIYTKEIPKPGYPGEWTVPGQGVVCYIHQEGGEDMQIFTGSPNTLRINGKPLTTTDFADRLDGKRTGTWLKSQGFHGIMFETATTTQVGIYYYTLRAVDKWGKEKLATIVYKALGRDEAIPSYAVPSEDGANNYWWGHRIED